MAPVWFLQYQRVVLRLCRVVVVLTCLAGCRRHAATPEPPAATAESAPKPAPPKPSGALRIKLAVLDQTEKDERPIELGKDLRAMAEAAARRAGVEVSDDGMLAGIEVHYALLDGDKPAPNAPKGLLTWAAQVTLRVEDGGLGEDLQSLSKSESPYVRAATPDLRKALNVVLGACIEQALRDALAQARFRKLEPKEALAALSSDAVEERWAAIRRLADLRDVAAIPKIAAFLEDEDELTVNVAIAALGQIRDERAVEPLAKAAEGPDVERALAVVEALAAIGGPKAKKYLELIGASHPSDRVRDRVKELQVGD